jgi:phosphoribosylformylglycinamidine synthase subunit PurL
VALAESCLSGKLGAQIDLSLDSPLRWDKLLFGEGGARIVVSVSQKCAPEWESYLKEHLASDWQKLGEVTEAEGNLQIKTSQDVIVVKTSMKEMSDRFFQAIPKRLNS